MLRPSERGSVYLKLLSALLPLMFGPWVLYLWSAPGRTARGTGNSTSSATCTITSVTVGATGSTLWAFAYLNTSKGSTPTAAWGATSMTEIDDSIVSGTGELTTFYLPNASSGTNNLVVTNSKAAGHLCAASELTGVTTAPLDIHKIASGGSSSSPDSGSAGTTAQASEILMGALGFNITSAIGGTWSNSWSDGQPGNITTGAIDEGFFITSSAQAADAAKTGTTAGLWIAAIAAFKGSGGAPAVTPPLLMRGFGLIWLRPWLPWSYRP